MHSPSLIRGPQGGNGQDKNKDLGGPIIPYFPTTPEVALGVRRDHWFALWSGLALGTRDQLTLAPIPHTRVHC